MKKQNYLVSGDRFRQIETGLRENGRRWWCDVNGGQDVGQQRSIERSAIRNLFRLFFFGGLGEIETFLTTETRPSRRAGRFQQRMETDRLVSRRQGRFFRIDRNFRQFQSQTFHSRWRIFKAAARLRTGRTLPRHPFVQTGNEIRRPTRWRAGQSSVTQRSRFKSVVHFLMGSEKVFDIHSAHLKLIQQLI